MRAGDFESFGFWVEESQNEKMNKLSLFVDGQDILEGVIGGEKKTFEWNINEPMKWLQDNLNNIIKEDAFPENVHGRNAAEIYEASFDVMEMLEMNDEEEYDRYTKIQNWVWRHSWIAARSGSFLAIVFFRRVGNNVEISWKNEKNEKWSQVDYVVPFGMKQVDVNEFKDVVQSICTQFFSR